MKKSFSAYNSSATNTYDNDEFRMGTQHMVGNDDFEPMRTNNFEVQITNLDTLVKAGGGSIGGMSGATETIMLSVASYAAPQINISPITVQYANNSVKFAGKPEFPDSSIVLNDFIGKDVEKILSNWQKAVYDPETEQIGLASNYKKQAVLIEYDPQGCLVRSWTLFGCWPSQLQLGDFNQDGNAVRQVTVTLTYDKAIPNEDPEWKSNCVAKVSTAQSVAQALASAYSQSTNR